MLNTSLFNGLPLNAIIPNGGDIILPEHGTSSDMVSSLYVIIGKSQYAYWYDTTLINDTKQLDLNKTYDDTLDASIFFSDFFGTAQPTDGLPDSGIGSDLIKEVALVLPTIFDSGVSVDTLYSLLVSLNIPDIGIGVENISLVQFVNVLKILTYMKQNLNINTNQKDTLNLNTNMPVY